jgi:uncharacterized protein (TIGR02391 family)
MTMPYAIKNDILNEILKALSTSNGLSIEVFLKYKIGITVKEVVDFYEAKLKQDGYATNNTFADNTKSFYITPLGMQFYESGGYNEKSKRRLVDMLETTSKSRVFTFVKSAAAESENKNNLTKKAENQKTQNFVINDKQQLDYVAGELDEIFEKLEAPSNHSLSELRRYDAELKVLIETVFLPQHSFHKKKPIYIIDKQAILEYFKPALHIIELHLLSLSTDLSNLHDLIKDDVEKLFNNEHYGDAVFKSFKAIEIAVKQKSGVNKIGTALMDDVFSSRKPLLRFSEDESYQQGYMFLYKGAIGAIRNQEGHNKVEYTKEEAFETINFASLLLRYLDKSKSINHP